MEGVPWRGVTGIALLPLPLPTFLKAVEEVSWPVSMSIALRRPEAFLAHNWGGRGVVATLGGESPPSLTSSPPAPSAGATASHASPWGWLPQRSTD